MILIIAISVLQCSPKIDNTVGFIKSGKYEFESMRRDSIIRSWNELLAKNNLKSTIKDFTIVKGIDYGNKKEYYGLLGTTTADSVNMMRSLIVTDQKFYFDEDQPITVICH